MENVIISQSPSVASKTTQNAHYIKVQQNNRQALEQICSFHWVVHCERQVVCC